MSNACSDPALPFGRFFKGQGSQPHGFNGIAGGQPSWHNVTGLCLLTCL